MTIKERLHKLVDELSDAEASRARIVVEDERFLQKRRTLDARDTADAYGTSPQLEPDGWADLAAVNELSRDAVLDRLADEERAGGVKPW